MMIKYSVFKEILPIKPCKAEDSYILFKVLTLKYKVVLCEEFGAETERTKTAENEELSKEKPLLAYIKPYPTPVLLLA